MRAVRRPQLVPVSDRAQGDDEGRAGAARAAIDLTLRSDHERGRGGRRRRCSTGRATQLGVTVNEMFGQTEINYVVGNCQAAVAGEARAAWAGRIPGHRVAVIDDDGNECPRGEPGDVAVHRTTSTASPTRCSSSATGRTTQATRDKFTGDWCRTGDHGDARRRRLPLVPGPRRRRVQGAGYRIGPSEIENCLVKHPAVANAAVVGKPDASAARSSRRSSCCSRASAPSRALDRGNAEPRARQARARTSTRRRSSSSTRCR